MADVITLSSDSDKDDSDVEIIGSFGAVVTKASPLPLSAVRVTVDVPTLYIDLTDARWSPPELKHKRPNPSALMVEDLKEVDTPAESPCSEKESKMELGPREDRRDDFCSPALISCITSTSSFQDETQGSLRREVSILPNSPTTGPNPSEHFDLDSRSHTNPISHNLVSQVDQTLTSEQTRSESPSERQREKIQADEASNGFDFLHWSAPNEPLFTVSNEDMEDRSEAGTYRGDLGMDSPVSFVWQEGSDEDEVNKGSRFDMDFMVASREDRQFVCPVTLRKIMSGPVQALFDEEDKGFGAPEVLCRQSLSLVYSTMDENYPEGTLQLLSDLLQPSYYPPRDITSHLLRGILLDAQCPHHLCVQAFNLLKRTQRHHMADNTTVSWDWELLTSVMADQKHPCEVVRMLLDYIVQTLEDDFQAKRSISALHHSIAKATLSCDQQFPRVRMVSIFQRMLSLALEVDRSPALNSAKLSQELFHMLISNIPLRAQRILLLESLQSKLLRCKLLEHLLDYACPLKTPLPMSLSLLLHFLKYCTLAPDPSDGTERWQRWEELVHLLWMLLLSYNKAMKGYLCNSVSEQRGDLGNLVYKPDDMIFKPAICDAVEAFLSRSRADLGQDLPLHVEESLTYLQDHLLDDQALLSTGRKKPSSRHDTAAETGMPKEKYDPPDPRRMYTIMSTEESTNGKKSYWAELEISGRVRSLSTALWSLTHLTALHISDNSLSRIPPDIAKLHNLVYLDLSSNKIRSLPSELGNMVSLRELLLNNNQLRVLPFELGKLFQLQTLGLKGNPLAQEIMSLYQEPDGTRRLLNYLLDNLAGAIKRIPTELPPARSWISLQEPDRTRASALFSVMCYNVLCDKYATRQLYGYCPSWALNWEYRKKSIMQEIMGCNADIISLQEVETEQYYNYFLPELKEQGYEGFFSPKSRARTMSESDRKHVDGCAIFYKTEKFSAVQKHTVEFNQLAMANSEGSEAMLNRVMTKDNIGVATLLEVRKEMMEASSGKSLHGMEKQLLLVANAHMHWDPEYSDVKLVQTMMFLSEVKNIVDKATRSLKLSSVSGEINAIPLVLCADLNSLPDSGVVEYLSTGGVDCTHKDFKELRYSDSLSKFNCNGKSSSSNGRITHGFKLKTAYENGLMPYTNYTFDFKGVIDYMFYSKPHLNVLGILGPLDPHWLVENNVSGCPHPHIPSDHFSLFGQLELLLPNLPPQVNGLHLPARR
ncbi:CCR4-NOT transcription complex subunit 6 [Liparis tanakae]|uniref:poly(A)-specific ribonuclease n=1 Tax=Liparis tanakae TaxID=230148 RepID=A0A4Z2HGY4_9TELE|nr:CCR4-NOT transcription complex subunit 6 [Liparis tanakae]